MELLIDQKKEWARELYTRGGITQKAIASKVGISEQSLVKWIQDGRWDEMRKTLLTTKSENLKMLYQILDGLNKEALQALSDDDPETQPASDKIIKICAAIAKLERDTGVGEMIETAKALIDFVTPENLEEAKLIAKWFDLFIKDRLKGK